MATDFEKQLIGEHKRISKEEGVTDDFEEEIEEEIEEGAEIEEPETEEPEVGESDEQEETEEAEEPAAKAEDDTPLIPPHTWPEDLKKDFSELPRVAQKRMLEINGNLYKGFQQRMTEVGRLGRELGSVQQAVKGHAERLHRAGIDPATAIQRALAWDAHISQNGPQGLLDMAKAYGFDPAQIQQPANQEYMTPTERQLQEQVATLSQAFQQREQDSLQRQQQWQHSQRQAHEQRAVQQLEGFMQETGPDGKLKHPYVDHVANNMARLITSGVVNTLEDAYEMAAMRSPEIKAALESQRQAARVHEQRQKAAKARNASEGIIAKSPDKQGGSMDFESQLRATARKLRSTA